ncbi:MAG: acylphosphatase [Methanothrix sp.]|nr:acylphosphatase [Methanothrix sp.]
MKLKVKIAGPKVHGVGYRYFLMSNAIDLGLKGFHARNRTGENGPEVTALVEGNEETIADFKKLVETQKPDHSQVSSIVFEDYEGDIMRTSEYAFVCTNIQLNKAIPLLLDMRDNLKEMTGDLKELKGDIKELKGDIKELKGDMKAVRKNTDIIPQIGEDIKAVKANTSEVTEEIKGMREDIQPGYARQMQADVRAIKERLGMQ